MSRKMGKYETNVTYPADHRKCEIMIAVLLCNEKAPIKPTPRIIEPLSELTSVYMQRNLHTHANIRPRRFSTKPKVFGFKGKSCFRTQLQAHYS